jgi:hypothetical protein
MLATIDYAASVLTRRSAKGTNIYGVGAMTISDNIKISTAFTTLISFYKYFSN